MKNIYFLTLFLFNACKPIVNISHINQSLCSENFRFKLNVYMHIRLTFLLHPFIYTHYIHTQHNLNMHTHLNVYTVLRKLLENV